MGFIGIFRENGSLITLDAGSLGRLVSIVRKNGSGTVLGIAVVLIAGNYLKFITF